MQILWTHHFAMSPCSWEPDLYGVFFKNKSPCFLYKSENKLCLLSRNCDALSTLYIFPEAEPLPLPSNWFLTEDGNRPIVFITNDVVIDLLNCNRICPVPESLLLKYHASIKPEKYLVEHAFSWGDYCISHKGNCGYVCTHNNEQVWRFRGRGYLYTEIYRWNNRVFFGTAGNGGFFYVLDIDDGSVVAAINTGGTTNLVHIENLCYVMVRYGANHAKLVGIDLQNGCIEKEIVMTGTATMNSRIQRIGDQIHVITFSYRKKQLGNAIWTCVAI